MHLSNNLVDEKSISYKHLAGSTYELHYCLIKLINS